AALLACPFVLAAGCGESRPGCPARTVSATVRCTCAFVVELYEAGPTSNLRIWLGPGRGLRCLRRWRDRRWPDRERVGFGCGFRAQRRRTFCNRAINVVCARSAARAIANK